jgi:hypothetical protein
MGLTNIAAVWDPQIWIQGVSEGAALAPVIFNSGLVRRGELFDGIASGPGTVTELPFWTDFTDSVSDEIQVEDTAPTINALGNAKMKATVLNRVSAWGVTALAAQIVGDDPVAEITRQLALWRLMRRQATLLATLRGVMGTGVQTPGQAQGCLRANRKDIFSETGASPTSEKLIDVDSFLDTVALLGELSGNLQSGAIYMHSNIKTALEKIDAASFKNGVESGLPFRITTYRGTPVFVSDKLVRAGTTSGFVYDTYIAAPGQVGYGEKMQTADTGDTVDTAALQFDSDKSKNNQYLYDRTRFLLHVNGTRWGGTPSGSSATNAELQTHGNWTLVSSSANRVGIACLRSNG